MIKIADKEKIKDIRILKTTNYLYGFCKYASVLIIGAMIALFIEYGFEFLFLSHMALAVSLLVLAVIGIRQNSKELREY